MTKLRPGRSLSQGYLHMSIAWSAERTHVCTHTHTHTHTHTRTHTLCADVLQGGVKLRTQCPLCSTRNRQQPASFCQDYFIPGDYYTQSKKKRRGGSGCVCSSAGWTQAEGRATADWLMCLYDLRGWLRRGSCRVHKAACLQTGFLALSVYWAFIICLCVMSEELKLEILSGKFDFFLLFRFFFFLKRHQAAAELTGLFYFCLLLFLFDWLLFH